MHRRTQRKGLGMKNAITKNENIKEQIINDRRMESHGKYSLNLKLGKLKIAKQKESRIKTKKKLKTNKK